MAFAILNAHAAPNAAVLDGAARDVDRGGVVSSTQESGRLSDSMPNKNKHYYGCAWVPKARAADYYGCSWIPQ